MQNLFLDITFPHKICQFERNVLEFFTIVQKSKNGAENRVILNSSGSVKYLCEGGILKKSDAEVLATFFKIVKGRGFSFRFFDAFENKAQNENLEKISENSFQLVKSYDFQGFKTIKKITKPIYKSIKLFYKNEILIENKDYKIEYFSGNVKILNVKYLENIEHLKADFSFDIEVRFEHDELKMTQDKFGNLFLSELTITEIL